MQVHDNHIAAYYFRQAALADKAKSDAYDDELVRRYLAGLPVGNASEKLARQIIRARNVNSRE